MLLLLPNRMPRSPVVPRCVLLRVAASGAGGQGRQVVGVALLQGGMQGCGVSATGCVRAGGGGEREGVLILQEVLWGRLVHT